MFLSRPLINTPAQREAKEAILELLHFERFCRDNQQWEEMYKCFAKDSFVNISWYQGSGEGFVMASSKMALYAPHKIYNSLTWLNDACDKGVTIMMTTISATMPVNGVDCQIQSDAKLIFRTQKIDGQWYIMRFESIYEQDRLVPVLPNNQLNVDPAMLKKYRSSYACLSYCFDEHLGGDVHYDLMGRDRPELIEKFYQETKDWLES